ncbi:kinesin-like protein KIF20B isoform X1 [Astyanax mexicanus]|uniref:Kinesin-like protein KIF20B isoform X1 n=1 Tax=Astyanax mexicanus TaxID=7994 RepID=A0A8T2LEI7_ASTMX|nr:kinesin-like protein KIF20B isoform X1 [Astyanax mexicanus]
MEERERRIVSPLEIQLKKLVSSTAEKDKQIQDLQCNVTTQTQEIRAGDLQARLNKKEAEIHRLQEELSKLAHTISTKETKANLHRDSSTQVRYNQTDPQWG